MAALIKKAFLVRICRRELLLEGMRKGMGFLRSVSNSIISLCATLFLILVDVKLFFQGNSKMPKENCAFVPDPDRLTGRG